MTTYYGRAGLEGLVYILTKGLRGGFFYFLYRKPEEGANFKVEIPEEDIKEASPDGLVLRRGIPPESFSYYDSEGFD